VQLNKDGHDQELGIGECCEKELGLGDRLGDRMQCGSGGKIRVNADNVQQIEDGLRSR